MRFGLFGSSRMLFFGPDGGGGTSAQPAQQQAPPQPPLSPQPPPQPQNGANGNGAQQQHDDLPQGMKQGADGQVQVLTQKAFRKLREQAEERGQRRALDAMAKEFGFATVAEMKAHFGGRAAATPPVRQERASRHEEDEEPRRGEHQDEHRDERQGKNGERQQYGSKQERKEQERWQREKMQMQKEKDDLARRMSAEARERKALQKALDAKDAEMMLRETAVLSGIKDVDYAVRLLTRHLDGMSEDERAKLEGGKAFDEAKFFEGLRTSHPYLFGEVTKPLHTGTGAGQPPPPKPGAAAQQQAQAGQVDARKMSREEFQEHLRKRGLNVGM